MKNEKRHLEILRLLLSSPTAPFRERSVVEQVGLWAQRRGVDFRQDSAGNVVLRYGSGIKRRPSARAARKPLWVFTGHLDHPGFAVVSARGLRVVAEFMGSVRQEYFVGSRVRFFGGAGEATARVTQVRAMKDSHFLQCRLQLDAPARLNPGDIGMWDLPAMSVRRGRLLSRACDDLAGSAAVLCAIDDLVEASRRSDEEIPEVMGLLTRAEEVGFIGALAACRAGTIPRGARVVGIETSRVQPAGPLGSGVVVRVGDAMRTFDPALTALISGVAAKLAKEDSTFRFTRQLMPGGACESTAYQVMGHRAAALCLPLGNYHNQGTKAKIAAEQVSLSDFECLVKLLVALAGQATDVDRIDVELRKRFDERLDAQAGFLYL